MRQKQNRTPVHQESRLIRIINRLVSAFLFLSLLILFQTVFRKLFGTSDAAWIVGLALSVTLATIACTLLTIALPALLVLLLIVFPSIALIVIFLLM